MCVCVCTCIFVCASVLGPTNKMTLGEEGNHEQVLNSPFRVPGKGTVSLSVKKICNAVVE